MKVMHNPITTTIFFTWVIHVRWSHNGKEHIYIYDIWYMMQYCQVGTHFSTPTHTHILHLCPLVQVAIYNHWLLRCRGQTPHGRWQEAEVQSAQTSPTGHVFLIPILKKELHTHTHMNFKFDSLESAVSSRPNLTEGFTALSLGGYICSEHGHIIFEWKETGSPSETTSWNDGT